MPNVADLLEELDEDAETEKVPEHQPTASEDTHLDKLLKLCSNKTAVNIEDIFSSQVLKSSIKTYRISLYTYLLLKYLVRIEIYK